MVSFSLSRRALLTGWLVWLMARYHGIASQKWPLATEKRLGHANLGSPHWATAHAPLGQTEPHWAYPVPNPHTGNIACQKTGYHCEAVLPIWALQVPAVESSYRFCMAALGGVSGDLLCSRSREFRLSLRSMRSSGLLLFLMLRH
jgi:hypothetical protein